MLGHYALKDYILIIIRFTFYYVNLNTPLQKLKTFKIRIMDMLK